MSEGNKFFRAAALSLIGLLVVGLIAIDVLLWAVRMGYLPSSPVPEPQPKIEERFATKTPEEKCIIEGLLATGWQYTTVDIPKQVIAFLSTDPTYSNVCGEEPGVGVFFHSYSVEHVNGIIDTYYEVHFEHALYDRWLFIDGASDGGVERIYRWHGCSTELEHLLTHEPFGEMGETVFDRPPPGGDSKLSEAFDLANELINYLK